MLAAEQRRSGVWMVAINFALFRGIFGAIFDGEGAFQLGAVAAQHRTPSAKKRGAQEMMGCSTMRGSLALACGV